MSNDATNAAIIQGAGNVSAAAVTNSGNRKSQERANEMNLEFWRMQNDYNNPSSQMERLRTAGLNPNLIYGTSPTSAVGNAEKIQPSKATPYNMPNPMSDIGSYAAVRNTNQQTDNLKAQNTVLTQEAILKAAQTGKTLSEGSSAATKAKVDKALLDTSVQASKENLRSLEQTTIGNQLDNRLKDQSLKDKVKRIYYEAQHAKSNLKGTNLNNKLKELEIELNQYGIQKGDNLFYRILGRHFDEFIKPLQNKNKGNIFNKN